VEDASVPGNEVGLSEGARADGTSDSSAVGGWGFDMVTVGLLRLNVDNEAADLADLLVADT